MSAVPPSGPPATPPPSPSDVIAEVAALLRARGERMTGPRRAVLTVLAVEGRHLSAEEVVAKVASSDLGVHRASVYRTLEALSGLGVVQGVHVGHSTAYHLVPVDDRHLHAHCRDCRAVIDLPPDLLDGVATELSRRYGFALDPGHVALSGLCAGCRAAES